MPIPQNTFLSQKHLRTSDKRIILLTFSAFLLCIALSCRISGQGVEASVSNSSLQLVARGSDLYFAESSGQSQGRIATDLTPFFFQPVPVNFADAELIATIKGIGPQMAKRIVQIRTRIGHFTNADTLRRVPGIGRTRIHQLQGQLSFQTRP